MKTRGTSATEKAAAMVQRATSRCPINLWLVPPKQGTSYTFEQVLEATTQLTTEQLHTLKAEANFHHWKTRSEIQAALLRTFQDIMKLRELAGSCKDGQFSAHKPPHWVPPLAHLRNLHQKGYRFDEVSKQQVEYTIRDLFEQPLTYQYAIILIGSNGTSGYGKSFLSYTLAFAYSRAYQEVARLPRDCARVISTTTIDGAREIAFRDGDVWVADDVSPNDPSQKTS